MTLNVLRPSHPRDERNTHFFPYDARHTLATTVTRTIYHNGYYRTVPTIVFKTTNPPLLQNHETYPLHSIFFKLPTFSTHNSILIPNLVQSVLQTPWPTNNKLPLSLSDPAKKEKPNGSNSRSFNAAVSNLHGMLILTV